MSSGIEEVRLLRHRRLAGAVSAHFGETGERNGVPGPGGMSRAVTNTNNKMTSNRTSGSIIGLPWDEANTHERSVREEDDAQFPLRAPALNCLNDDSLSQRGGYRSAIC
jgi:hypothetical protein